MSVGPRSASARIELCGVSKWYNRQTRRRLRTAWPGRCPTSPGRTDIVALRDVDLAIADGEVLGIIGNNGAGKTTLLRLVAGVTAPSSGEVRVRGEVASMIELGLGFHPHLTGAENLSYSAQLLGMGPNTLRDRWEEIVDFSGIGDALDQPIRQYSTGMLARLGFSLAAHSDAPVILLDEVLAVGDYSFQKRSLNRMRALADEGRTLLVVTHNLPSVVDVCHRVLQLVDGTVATVGAPGEIVASYVAQQHEHRTGDSDGLHIGKVSVRPGEIDVGGSVSVHADITIDRPLPSGTVVLRIGVGSTLYGGMDPSHESMDRLVDWPLTVPCNQAGTWSVTATIDDFPLYAADYGIGFAIIQDGWDELVRRLTPLVVHGDRERRQLRIAVTETIQPLDTV